MKLSKKRILSEKEFHNKIFANNKRFYLNKYYDAVSSAKIYYQKLIQRNSFGSVILEYGCGPDSQAFILSDGYKTIHAIDISEFAIKEAKNKALFNDKKIIFRLMNAEKLRYSKKTFDLICGSGILHHLDLERAYSEISRVLKKSGEAIFYEPLGHNFLINLYRLLTPKLRTIDEHPLVLSDIELASNYFKNVKVQYFGLFSIFSAFCPPLKNFLLKLDVFLFKKFPFLRKYSWIVVLTLSMPLCD